MPIWQEEKRAWYSFRGTVMKPPAVAGRELQNRQTLLELPLYLPGNFRIFSFPASGKLPGGLKGKAPAGQPKGRANVIDKDYPVFVRGFARDVPDEMDPAVLPRFFHVHCTQAGGCSLALQEKMTSIVRRLWSKPGLITGRTEVRDISSRRNCS